VDPAEVGYVELHGTGTRVGDPIEAARWGRPTARPERQGRCWSGSAKTNVGHLEGAAGIVGLLKALLAVAHRVLPPSLNYSDPTRRSVSPNGSWPSCPSRRRFPTPGAGGSVVLRHGGHQLPRDRRVRTRDPGDHAECGSGRPGLAVSGHGDAALREQAASLLAHVRSRPDLRAV